MESQILLCDVKAEYNLNDINADFVIYNTSQPEYTIACTNMGISNPSNISGKRHIYIQGHIVKHRTEVEGVYTYSIDAGAETDQDMSKTYISVQEAINACVEQAVDVPSENIYYIEARANNVRYYRR